MTQARDLDTVAAATGYLYRLPRGGKDVGLARAGALFDRLGSPQNAVRTVHVAGTAGKGSVGAFVAAMLSAHGHRVGVHLSPHVRSILERFQFGGDPIHATDFVDAVRTLAPVVESMVDTPLGAPTFFEAANAIAFTRFAAEQVDYAVVETGIGGLLDATNTITRRDKLAVVTRIGIDHTDLLGDTVAEIARHKAGILPTGGHGIVLRHHQDSVRAAIAETARVRHCSLDVVDPREISCRVSPAGTSLRLDDADLPLGLQGRHQGVNAALALRTVRFLARRDGWRLDPHAVREGLARAWLPGRFERRILDGREVILDGAHNGVKLAALVDTLRALHPDRRANWVLAVKADKDLHAVLAAIAPVAHTVVATEFAGSIPAGTVAEQARVRGLCAVAVVDPVAAVRTALVTGDGPVVVSGSFLHLGAVDDALGILANTRQVNVPARRNPLTAPPT